jgi:hypothetical protein
MPTADHDDVIGMSHLVKSTSGLLNSEQQLCNSPDIRQSNIASSQERVEASQYALDDSKIDEHFEKIRDSANTFKAPSSSTADNSRFANKG